MRVHRPLVKAYALFLALLPVLDLYKSPIPMITAGEMLLIAFALVVLAGMCLYPKTIVFSRSGVNILPVSLSVSLFVITCIAVLSLGGGSLSPMDVVNRFARLVLWAFSISFTGFYLLEAERVRKRIIDVAVIATCYVVLQSVFWRYFGIYLPSSVSAGPIAPVSAGYADAARLLTHYASFYYRPAGLFAEPAYYSYYVLIALVLTVYPSRGETTSRKYIVPVLLSIGIVISTSTAGIYLMLLVWGHRILGTLFGRVGSGRTNWVVALGILLLLGIMGLFVLSTYGVTGSTASLGMILGKPVDFSGSARLGQSLSLFGRLSGFQKCVGVGLGNEDIYLGLGDYYYNSVTAVLLGTGYVGFVAFLVFAVRTIKVSKSVQAFMLSSIYVLLCFTSGILYSCYSIVYLTLAYYSESRLG